MRLLVLIPLLSLVACGARQDEAVFAPQGSEFKVTFPGKPKLSEVTGQGGLFNKPTTLKVATRATQYMLLKADVAVVPPGSFESFTKDGLIAYGFSYGENQGFESVETKFEEKPFAKCLTVRGSKKVQGQPTTFLMRMCLGSRTLFTQYIASASDIFPPPGTQQFLDTLRPM